MTYKNNKKHDNQILGGYTVHMFAESVSLFVSGSVLFSSDSVSAVVLIIVLNIH